MKVLFFLTYYTPHISGPVRYLEQLTDLLAQAKISVHILTSRHQATSARFQRHGNITIERLPIWLQIGKGVIMPLLPIAATRAISTTDVVVVNLPQPEAGFIALLCRIHHKPLVAIHHTDLSGWSGWWHQVSETLTNLSGLIACRQAAAIVPYTLDYARHSAFLTRFKDKIIPIPPIIHLSATDPEYQQYLRDRFPKNISTDKVIYLGYAGRLAKQKRLEDALSAIKLLNQRYPARRWRLLIAGGPAIGERYGWKFSHLAKKYPYISLLGELSPPQLAAFYRHIEVLVLPSNDRLESFGMVQAEAMMSGCPVVATNLPGARVPITLTKMGKLVPPNQSSRLADAIYQVITTPSYRSATKIKRAKEVFNPHHSAAKFIRLLQQVTSYHQNENGQRRYQ